MMILSEITCGVGIIRLNRPEKRNALSPGLISGFRAALRDFKLDESVRVIIITGTETSFCAGADLSYLSKLRENSIIENERDSFDISRFFVDVYETDKPVIAAVNGPAIAGGCGLATACDFVFADRKNARFGYSEVRIGFVPAIVSFLLLKRVGEVKARQMLISAEIMDAEQALRAGIADRLCDDPLTDAVDFAGKLIKNSGTAMAAVKKMLRDISIDDYKAAVSSLVNINVLSRTTEDFKNGLKNFLEKDR